jgi:FkbM family methyltransferase
MSIRDGVKWYSDLCGFRGVAMFCGYRLFGWPKEITARPPGIQHPVHIRIKTTDELIYRSVLLENEYAFELPFYPNTILDAGANIGTTSIYFANRFPHATIVAVEAEKSNFAMLVRNVHPYPAIIPIHAALWNREGEINIDAPDFTTGAYGEWGFVAHDGGAGTLVRAVTVQTLMQELRIQSFDLAKIDIEGAEQEVFEDTRWLIGTRCLMIELHDRFRPGCSKAVEAATRGFVRSQRGETTFYVQGSTEANLAPCLAAKGMDVRQS